MEYEADYGLKIIQHLGLYDQLNFTDRNNFREHWAWVLRKHRNDPIEATIDLFGSILPMSRDMSKIKRSETGELRTRKEFIEDKMDEFKIREHFEAGRLNQLLEMYQVDD